MFLKIWGSNLTKFSQKSQFWTSFSKESDKNLSGRSKNLVCINIECLRLFSVDFDLLRNDPSGIGILFGKTSCNIQNFTNTQIEKLSDGNQIAVCSTLESAYFLQNFGYGNEIWQSFLKKPDINFLYSRKTYCQNFWRELNYFRLNNGASWFFFRKSKLVLRLSIQYIVFKFDKISLNIKDASSFNFFPPKNLLKTNLTAT